MWDEKYTDRIEREGKRLMPKTQISSIGSSDDILAELTGETQSAIARLGQVEENPLEKLQEVSAQMDEAAKMTDEKARSSRLKILEATFDTVNQTLENQTGDYAKAILGLQGLFVSFGKEYQDLQKPTASELAITANAESRLAAARQDLSDAGQKWNIFGARDRAIENANAEIAAAETGITEAKSRVAEMVRNRLMTADIDSSLQTLMRMVSEIVTIMEARKKAVEQQVKEVSVAKDSAFNVKERAAQALQKLDEELKISESSLQAEEEALTGLSNGSPEYAAQTTKISRLREEVESLRGRRNAALVLYQSKEKFAMQLEVHLKTQIKLRDNQLAWITLLKSDTEGRVVTFKSFLEAMKARADQDIAENINTVGVEMDRSTTEGMAMIASASDKAAMKMVEGQPERVKALHAIMSAQAEASAAIRDRMGVAIEDFRRLYGINPLDASFFHYANNQLGGSGESVQTPENAGV